jgi:hypothetical protein
VTEAIALLAEDGRMSDLPADPFPASLPGERGRWIATPAARRAGRIVAAAVPVVLVNLVAFAGQVSALNADLPAWPPIARVALAVALESVAVYLAWHAHLAQLANDSALRLRLAAYGFALGIAALNYSHFAGPHWRPTFPAVAVALCSAASPWLWGVHSRRVSRDRLMAAGLVEPHALRLGGTRWTWHPWRSARVMWLATWQGITDPAEALAAAAARELPAPALDAELLAAMTGRDRLAVAFGALGRADVPAALALLDGRGAPIDQSEAYKHRAAMLDGQARRPAARAAGGGA